MPDDRPDLANLQDFCRGLQTFVQHQQLNRFWMQHHYSGEKVCLTVFGASELTILVEHENESPSEFYLNGNSGDISFSWHGARNPDGQEEHYFASPTVRQLAELLETECRLGQVPAHVINLVQQIGGETGYRGVFRFIDTP